MKKIVLFLVVIMALPHLTAYAASVTSRSFVVRNWKAKMPTTPLSTEEIETGELEGEEPTIPPDDDQTIPPASTTLPTSTDEVEPGEAEGEEQKESEDKEQGEEEQGEEIEPEEPEEVEHSEPVVEVANGEEQQKPEDDEPEQEPEKTR